MPGEIYEVLSLGMRYWFTLLGVLIVLRAFFWLRRDRREKHRRLRNLPDAGCIGEFVVEAGSDELPAETTVPVPREGVLGFNRTCDVVVPVDGVAAQHLDLSFVDRVGLLVRPRHGLECRVDDQPMTHRAKPRLTPLVHGSRLCVGEAVLRLNVFEGVDLARHAPVRKDEPEQPPDPSASAQAESGQQAAVREMPAPVMPEMGWEHQNGPGTQQGWPAQPGWGEQGTAVPLFRQPMQEQRVQAYPTFAPGPQAGYGPQYAPPAPPQAEQPPVFQLRHGSILRPAPDAGRNDRTDRSAQPSEGISQKEQPGTQRPGERESFRYVPPQPEVARDYEARADTGFRYQPGGAMDGTQDAPADGPLNEVPGGNAWEEETPQVLGRQVYSTAPDFAPDEEEEAPRRMRRRRAGRRRADVQE